jgi:hypothetical protein
MKGANIVSYEPIFERVAERGRLFVALRRLADALYRLENVTGHDYVELLRRLVRHATRTDGGFGPRDGSDFINLPDGRTLRDLSRMHVMTKAFEDIAEAVGDDPEAEAKWDRAVSNILELILDTSWPDGGEPRFADPGSLALAVHSTSFLADRAREARAAGTLESWMTEDAVTLVEEFWNSRLLAGTVVLLEQVLADEENRAALDDFLAYMVGTPRGREQTSMMFYQILVRSMDVDAWIPLARHLSTIVDPDRAWEVERFPRLGLVSHGAMLLDRTLELDPDGAGLRMIHRAVDVPPSGPAPASVLVDVIGDYYRADPTSDAPFSAEDYQLFLERLAGWMSDDVHGMEQVYDLVELKTQN